MMVHCEGINIVSWYQHHCDREARYRVTRQVQYLNGKTEIYTRNLCGVCSKADRQHRRKLDAGTYYNNADLNHTYPQIQPLRRE